LCIVLDHVEVNSDMRFINHLKIGDFHIIIVVYCGLAISVEVAAKWLTAGNILRSHSLTLSSN